jgi:iron complex transport system ATP-binding protein
VTLRLEQVAVDIAGQRIVSGIDIDVPDGAFIALLGPNGSGKSTILGAVYRARPVAAGRVLLDGEDIHAMRHSETARRVAVLSQETVVEFGLTVREMVMLGRIPHKRAFERDAVGDRAIVAESLERVGCTHLANRQFQTLSGGERQRVLIARALAQGADHLLLDEPSNHLDIRYQMEVLELVSTLGVTTLAAFHDLGLASLFSEHVYLLKDGSLVGSGAPAEVITAGTIREVYGAEVVIVPHPDTGAPHPIPRRLPPPTAAGESWSRSSLQRTYP